MIQTLLNSIDAQLAHAATWTIVHSLWQGGLLALVMSYLQTTPTASTSVARYTLSVLALGTLLLSSIVTFCIYYYTLGVTSEATMPSAALTGTVPATASGHLLQQVRYWFDLRSETILLVWTVGVALLLTKAICGVAYIQWLRQGTEHPVLQQALLHLQDKIGKSAHLRLLASSRVAVPMVVGAIKPVVLFPLSLLTMLTIDEVEAILAHELAHVHRHDYAVNLVLHVVETLYYYHPAVWWISANIRAERENSCDDLAIAMGTDPLLYAQTLTKIEAMQTQTIPSMAMALHTDKHQLLNRIKRILNMKQTKSNIKEKTVATLLMLTVALLFSTTAVNGELDSRTTLLPYVEKLPAVHEVQSLKISSAAPLSLLPLQRLQLATMPQDTTPTMSRSSVTVQTETNGKKMKLQKENGKITHLEIDGEVIPESRYGEYEDLTDDVIIMGDGSNRSMFLFGDGGGLEGLNQRFFEFDSLDMLQGFPQDFAMPDMGRFRGMIDGMELPDIRQFEGDTEKLEEMIEQMMEGMEGIYGDSLRMERFDFDMDDFGNSFPQFFDNEGQSFQWSDDEEHTFPSRGNSRKNVAEVLGNELNRDGLLEPFKTNQIQLTGKHLKINGDKQPKNIWSKYKRIYEENSGIPLSKKARLDFPFEGKKSDRKIRSF